jgi:hypothetical protein
MKTNKTKINEQFRKKCEEVSLYIIQAAKHHKCKTVIELMKNPKFKKDEKYDLCGIALLCINHQLLELSF